MNQPIIGITSNIESYEFLPKIESDYFFLNHAYVKNILKLGGIPIILPTINQSNVARYMDILDGLILSGGNDINPLLYDESSFQGLQLAPKQKDNSDLLLIHAAVNHSLPILGICRGMQAINVALGGSLCQDLVTCGKETIQHLRTDSPFEQVHSVSIKPGTVLFSLLGKRVDTNSLHHQAVRHLGTSLSISAKSDDGVIEAIENEDGSIIGIQWHPELLTASQGEMTNLFTYFFEKCSKKSTLLKKTNG